jgi:hypothetical protein
MFKTFRSFEFWGFGFVSNFDIRVSDFSIGDFKRWTYQNRASQINLTFGVVINAESAPGDVLSPSNRG